MTQEKEPKFYETLLKQEKPLTEDQVENYLAEVSSVLLGIDKGLAILKKVGRKPDPKVIENQRRFNEIRSKLLSMVK